MHDMFLYRIITFMDAPVVTIGVNEHVATLGDRERVFTVRKVFYDDDMTPMYALPDINEPRCLSLQELKDKYPVYKPLWENPILDNEKSLKVWDMQFSKETKTQ